jgi:hypothetical protein
LRSLLFRWSLISTLLPLAVLAMAGPAAACERCRLLGTTAFHEPSLSGDDVDDALLDPHDDDQGGAGEFAATNFKWPQPNGRGTPVKVTYSFENLLDGGLLMPNGQPLSTTLIRKSVEEAFGLWASVAPLTFREVPDDGRTYAQGATQYGQIRFRHILINGPDPPPPAQPIAKAQAYFPTGNSALSGDVEFDHGDRWQEVGTLPQPDVLGAAVHEIGHTLGLAHTGVSTANMYWIFTRYSGLGTGALHSDDIAGIQFIYGAGRGRVVPLPIPEPATWALLLVAALWCLLQRRFA